MEEGRVVDCHQHLWPAALAEELRRRSRPPRLVGWTLHLDGEPAYDIDPADHDPGRREARDAADGIGRALLSLSSPLGIEALPAEEAQPLLDAWHDPATLHGRHWGRWAAPRLRDPDPLEVKTLLARPDVVGLQVPATALADPVAVERLAPLLEAAAAADRPVLVHPGPSAPAGDVPAWWPALTSYVAQQGAAWHAWRAAGRSLLPGLRICFVALAGLAPLHHERLVARGGPAGAVDRGVFYETSSYGPRTIDALLRHTGVDALVLGSDRPYADPLRDPAAEPGLGPAFARAVTVTNPHHLLNGGPG